VELLLQPLPKLNPFSAVSEISRSQRRNPCYIGVNPVKYFGSLV
jgi:hypothetical protein